MGCLCGPLFEMCALFAILLVLGIYLDLVALLRVTLGDDLCWRPFLYSDIGFSSSDFIFFSFHEHPGDLFW